MFTAVSAVLVVNSCKTWMPRVEYGGPSPVSLYVATAHWKSTVDSSAVKSSSVSVYMACKVATAVAIEAVASTRNSTSISCSSTGRSTDSLQSRRVSMRQLMLPVTRNPSHTGLFGHSSGSGSGPGKLDSLVVHRCKNALSISAVRLSSACVLNTRNTTTTTPLAGTVAVSVYVPG